MEIIKQLEARKYQIPTKRGEGFNNGIDTAIEILQSQTVIKCKAVLRDNEQFIFIDNLKLSNMNYHPQIHKVIMREGEKLIDIEIHIPKS